MDKDKTDLTEDKSTGESQLLKKRFIALEKQYNQSGNIAILAEMVEINYRYREISNNIHDLLNMPYPARKDSDS